jgi:acylphosphatase
LAAYRYLIHGRVQGVGYRYFAMREAEALGVRGFVRNLPDGSVEVVGEGPEETLAQFEERLKSGPSFGRVTGVERTPISARDAEGFHIR